MAGRKTTYIRKGAERKKGGSKRHGKQVGLTKLKKDTRTNPHAKNKKANEDNPHGKSHKAGLKKAMPKKRGRMGSRK